MPVARRPFVLVKESTGLYNPGAPLNGGEIIGLLPGARPGSPESWAVYSYSDASPGLGNGIPAPRFIIPHHRAAVRKEDATIAWIAKPGDTGYRVKISPNEDFSDPYWEFTIPPGAPPILPLTNTDIPLGTHWMKVQREAGSRQSAYSREFQITLVDLDLGSGQLAEVNGVSFAFQRKDTHMLCMNYGDNIEGYSQACNHRQWDKPHSLPPIQVEQIHPPLGPLQLPSFPKPWTCRPANSNLPNTWATVSSEDPERHGHLYCVMASISMISRAYSRPGAPRCISQDRLAFQLNEIEFSTFGTQDDDPDDDLRHSGASISPGYCTRLLMWALRPARHYPEGARLFFEPEAASFKQIHQALRDQRPIMSRWKNIEGDHVRVIDASLEVSPNAGFVHVLDPISGPRWERYIAADWRKYSKGTWFCPAVSFNEQVRSDEYEVWFDQDGDGIVDLDEESRFGTNKRLKDTDGDGMDDRADIVEYRFFGKPCDPSIYPDCTRADFDGDKKRKELDPDNDDDKCLDGKGDPNNFHKNKGCPPPPTTSCLGRQNPPNRP
ncbi:MAG: hypothetical protein V2I67_06460 [Thermoanaerobaculales bacterium]|jgi:hypothetical protein|nr:hypothetical protein [Thermoanaerobaculales bacterium]